MLDGVFPGGNPWHSPWVEGCYRELDVEDTSWYGTADASYELALDKSDRDVKKLFVLLGTHPNHESVVILAVIPEIYCNVVEAMVFALRVLRRFLLQVPQPTDKRFQLPHVTRALLGGDPDYQWLIPLYRERMIQYVSGVYTSVYDALNRLTVELTNGWGGLGEVYGGPWRIGREDRPVLFPIQPSWGRVPEEEQDGDVRVKEVQDDVDAAGATRSLGFETWVVAHFGHGVATPGPFLDCLELLMLPNAWKEPPAERIMPCTAEAFQRYVSNRFTSINKGKSIYCGPPSCSNSPRREGGPQPRTHRTLGPRRQDAVVDGLALRR